MLACSTVCIQSSYNMWKILLLSLAIFASALEIVTEPAELQRPQNFGFAVDYENNTFLLDGQPFQYVSGSFHYFRTPRQYWRDRLRKMREAGLNAVSTYVEWSLHQPEPNTWMWSGDADVVEFINIARQEDLVVLLRPGPYICAERDLGGLPPWLMTLVPDIKMRTNDARYMRYVEVYLNEILTRVEPLLRGNGGPIIMVQVENEYGSFHACDAAYKTYLFNIFSRHVGTKALLYTTDGSSLSALRCGFIPGAYTTIDFGTSGNVSANFAIMRQYQPSGPLVNSEFYPGWLTHWEEPFQKVSTHAVTKVLDEMLSMGASVNIYMFYGGTNFGFTSGANGPVDYSPQLTSYDYDAPLTEAGDMTKKYFEIRNIIGKYLPLPNVTLASVSPKGNYGPVVLKSVLRLLDPRSKQLLGSVNGTFVKPPTFEKLGIAHLLVLYEADLPISPQDPAVLYGDARDRALVYVDSHFVGTLSRMHKTYTIPLTLPYSKRIQILVENQGHLNFGNVVEDFKGLKSLTINRLTLPSWNVTGFKMNNIEPLRLLEEIDIKETGILHSGPIFLRGSFTISGTPLDTYLDTTGWGKGVAYVNGNNLGRYWPLVGPQMTLYVPATYLKTGVNELVVLELEYLPETKTMTFQNTADLGKYRMRAKRQNV